MLEKVDMPGAAVCDCVGVVVPLPLAAPLHPQNKVPTKTSTAPNHSLARIPGLLTFARQVHTTCRRHHQTTAGFYASNRGLLIYKARKKRTAGSAASEVSIATPAVRGGQTCFLGRLDSNVAQKSEI
jgi:hypothetical protein